MTQPLFYTPDVHFEAPLEKVAAMVDLPEDPNAWPKEVLDELYKQVPYIADFKPHVVMSKVNAERAFGFGHVEISNQSQAQQGTSPEALEAAGIRSVRIPVIIRDGKLNPFDLLVTDDTKVLPLTEGRLRQAIFRPQMFDVTSQTPGDQGMLSQLYPPYRQNYGFGGGGVGVPAGGMGKMGSAFEEELFQVLESLDAGHRKPKEKTAGTVLEDFGKLPRRPKLKKKTASILATIAPTISRADLNYFWDTVDADRGLQAQMRKNAAAMSAPLAVLVNPPIEHQEKRASVMADLVKPDVVQILKQPGGYLYKTASSRHWAPKTEFVDRGELVRRSGEKVAMVVDLHGGVTVGDGCVAREKLATVPGEPDVQPVTTSGLYKVMQEDGEEAVGFVIPNLLDTDGEALPLALFTNGTTATVQGEVMGKPLGQAADFPEAPPDGFGSFYTLGEEGEVIATIPLDLSSSYETSGEPGVLVGETYDGRPVEVSLQPNIKELVSTEDGKVLIPDWWKWMPLESAGNVALQGGADPAEEESEPYDLEAEAKEASVRWVEVRGDLSGTFDFSGPAVEKLAYEQRRGLDLDNAMFLLAGLGTEQGYGATKLAHAMRGYALERVKIGRLLTLASENVAQATKTASATLRNIPVLKRSLIKEASVIADPMAVDTVLSLGFINPENMMTFVSFLPTIEDAQAKLCRLLLAARIGLQGISATALERSIRGVEEVIEGLKTMAFQG